MGNYKIPLYALISLFLLSCEEPEAVQDQLRPVSKASKMLTGKVWKYNTISVEGQCNNQDFKQWYFQADQNSEPIAGGVASFRDLLDKRQIIYSRDGTYQLMWDPRGEYSLGTEGDPNWQPRFGSYKLVEDGEEFILIHNPNLPDEMRYEFELRDKSMVRTSQRYMSGLDDDRQNDVNYCAGSIVTYVENFTEVGVNNIFFAQKGKEHVPEIMDEKEPGTYVLTNYFMQKGCRFHLRRSLDDDQCKWGRSCNEKQIQSTLKLDQNCEAMEPWEYSDKIDIVFSGENGRYNITYNTVSRELSLEKVKEKPEPGYWIRGDFNSWVSGYPQVGRLEHIGNDTWAISNLSLQTGEYFKFIANPFWGGCIWGIIPGETQETGINSIKDLEKYCFEECRTLQERTATDLLFTGNTGSYNIILNPVANTLMIEPN